MLKFYFFLSVVKMGLWICMWSWLALVGLRASAATLLPLSQGGRHFPTTFFNWDMQEWSLDLTEGLDHFNWEIQLSVDRDTRWVQVRPVSQVYIV